MNFLFSMKVLAGTRFVWDMSVEGDNLDRFKTRSEFTNGGISRGNLTPSRGACHSAHLLEIDIFSQEIVRGLCLF